MNIDILKVGPLKTNCYILKIDNDCLIVDPGDEYDKIKTYLNNLNLIGILITHRHFDHIGALSKLYEEYKVPIFEFNNLEEKEYSIGKFKFGVIFTPGHTKDSVTYYFRDYKIIFVGDFIFKDTIGRCDLEGGDFLLMKESINKIKNFSDVTIYPGHGESTTLDYEKENNPYF